MIRWSEIEAECGGFRDGFVGTFRKYEGQDTDEKDARGRTVTVTMHSFARHMGIDKETFRRWARNLAQSVQPERRTQMDATRARTEVRRLPTEERARLVDELLAEPEVAKVAIEHVSSSPALTAQTIQRAGEKRPTPARPAREPSGLDYAAALGVGSTAVMAMRRLADDVSTLVAALRSNTVRTVDADAIREDVADLRKAGNMARGYADEIEIVHDAGGVPNDARALTEGN
jgi:transposase-like protein